MVLPLVAAAPYITGGIATLGAGLYAAQPYIQKAVDDYINRSVTPTGEGGIVDAYSDTQTGLQDWTTAFKKQDDAPKEVEGEYMPPGSGLPDPGDEDPDDEERRQYNKETIRQVINEILKGKHTYEDYKRYSDLFKDVKEVAPDVWELFQGNKNFNEAREKVRLESSRLKQISLLTDPEQIKYFEMKYPGREWTDLKSYERSSFLKQYEKYLERGKVPTALEHSQNPETIAKVIELAKQGITQEQISKEINLGKKRIYEILKDERDRGVEFPPAGARAGISLEDREKNKPGITEWFNEELLYNPNYLKNNIATYDDLSTHAKSKLENRYQNYLDNKELYDLYVPEDIIGKWSKYAGQKIAHLDENIRSQWHTIANEAKDTINPETLKPFTVEEWLFPRNNLTGTTLLDPAKYRQKWKDPENYLADKAAYQRNWKSKASGLDISSEAEYTSYFNTELNKALNFLAEYAKQNPGGRYSVKRDINGKPTGIIDSETGTTIHKAGYKGPLDEKNILVTQKENNPIWDQVVDLKEWTTEQRKFKHSPPADWIKKGFLEQFETSPTVNEIMNYLSYNDPSIYSPITLSNVGLELHHMELIGVKPLDSFQFVKRNLNNQAGKAVLEYHRSIANGSDEEEALAKLTKILSKHKINIRLPGQEDFIGGGKAEMSPKKAVQVHKANTTKLFKKRLEENPNLYTEIGNFFGLKKLNKLAPYTRIVDTLIGEVVPEYRDRVKRPLLTKKAQGGRVGYKEGGSVKPKINPIDYIVNYSDGTKLYKINSFIRDIARQIDY